MAARRLLRLFFSVVSACVVGSTADAYAETAGDPMIGFAINAISAIAAPGGAVLGSLVEPPSSPGLEPSPNGVTAPSTPSQQLLTCALFCDDLANEFSSEFGYEQEFGECLSVCTLP